MTQSPNLTEKIYLTYKTRMTTEARLRRTGFIAYVLLSWYSFALIAFSFLDLSNRFRVNNFSLISAIVSVGTFAISLFVYGERYTERADQFKNCYLKLQRLYESDIPATEKMARYSEILEIFDNQTDDDYDDMLFNALLRNQNLYNAKGEVKISCTSFAFVALRRVVNIVVILALFSIPILFAANWVEPLG
jgi:hypothetical protein